jgi:cytochrome b
MSTQNSSGYPLWDLPTRAFHWFLVVCLPLSWLSAELGYYEIHEWLGYTLIVLVTSRIIWGFLGSRHSRFSDFLRGPAAILAYLRGEGTASAGHNPLGGWSVVCLLALLLVQAVSGLFNTDEVFFTGPLYYAAEQELRDTMGLVHEVAFNILLGLVGLHVLAVIYHQRWKREPLVQAMVQGSATGKTGLARPQPVWRAVIVVLAVAGLLWGVLATAPGPPPLMW